MGRPRQVSDEEILDAARRCFLEHGTSVSIQVIADCVGISQPAIFKRFGTKQDLVLAALMPPSQRGIVRSIDPEHVATTLLGALHGRVFFEHVLGQPNPAPESFLTTLVDLLSRGLVPEELR